MDAVLLLDLDGLHQSPVLPPAVAVPITENVYLAPLYDIDALLARRLRQSLIGEVECLLQLAGNTRLHVL